MLNEYLTWQKKDKHADAYKVLTNDLSARIARNLGLEGPTKAKICLDCHADNVPENLRGSRFQLSDGVSCEACHGGAESYLGTHATGLNTRQKNLEAGLYPTEDPDARAKLCLRCHLGSQDNFISHKIYGAGHPRLSFELDTFTAIQPAHYRIDQDYKERKQEPTGIKVWAIGQVAAAEQLLALMEAPGHQGIGPWPELAFYDCHGCHHPMNSRSWTSRSSTAGLPPGTVRINDSSFLMLELIAQRTVPGLAEQFQQAIRGLHKATIQDRAAVTRAVENLKALTGKLREGVNSHAYSQDDMFGLLRDLTRRGLSREYNDYVAAEQIVMAIDAITNALPQSGGSADLRSVMGELYKSTKSQDRFKPARFEAALESLSRKLGAKA